MMAGIKNMLSCNMPAVIKKPTHKMILGAILTECHLVRFNSHPTKSYRSCLQCKCDINNTAHVCYHCPLAHYIWMVLENKFYII